MPVAARQALVLAHDADGLEADLLVGADGGGVVGRRVDRQPVVAALVDEVVRHRPDGVGAQPLPLHLLRQEEVDARTPVHRILLLVVLDQADHLAVELDRERHDSFVEAARLAPARDHRRLSLDLLHARQIRVVERPQDDALPSAAASR